MIDTRQLLGARRTAIRLTAGLLAFLPPAADAQQQACRMNGPLMRVANLPEASGVAASRRTPGVLWSHNDSGEPGLVAVATDGTTRGRVYVAGASAGDWEDIEVGPCPQGSCVYIGDIGDN